MSILITFEGIDASGKSTQIKLLSEKLEKEGYPFLLTRQPGGSSIGKAIREILLNPENTEMIPETEVLLYIADRLQHIQQVIQPALKENKIVLCDRYHDATMAYQGGGRQLDLQWLQAIQDQFIPTPDLTLWFDISVEISQVRLEARNAALNVESCRLEREDIAFFNRIRSAYQKFVENEPERIVPIDAEKDIQSIQIQVQEIVLNHLKGRV